MPALVTIRPFVTSVTIISSLSTLLLNLLLVWSSFGKIVLVVEGSLLVYRDINYKSYFNNLNLILVSKIMSTLRIRPDNGTIRELNIPKEKLEVLEKIVFLPLQMKLKRLMIKKFAEVSPCCICGGIPSLEVVYDVEFASRVERYCRTLC